MSQRSFTSRAARPVLILGVSAAILSLGLSACSKQKSGSPNPSQGTPAPASSAAAPPASAPAEGTPAPASPTSATAEPITRPRAGDCYQFPATDNSDDLTIVSCNQPHDAETFHAFEFRGDQFPTDDELDQASDEICGLMFEYYVGKPVADSTLDYEWVGPDQELWAQGDHIVECYAFAKDDSKLNRSIWNSNM